jgi:cell division protein FtsB
VNVDLGIWSKLTNVVIVLLVVAGLLLVGVWYYPVIKHNERVRKQILKLEASVQKEEETSRQLKTQIDALRHDPKAVERLARERLGYARTGETVIRFEAPQTNRPAYR